MCAKVGQGKQPTLGQNHVGEGLPMHCDKESVKPELKIKKAWGTKTESQGV